MIKQPLLLPRTITQIVLLSVGFAVLIGISATSVYLTGQARDDASLVTHTVQVENQISDSLLQLRRAESMERGYVISALDEFLDDYRKARAEIEPSFKQLHDLTVDNPVQQQLMMKIMPLVQTRIAEFDRVVDLAHSGKAAEAAKVVSESSSRTMTNTVRDLTNEMLAEEERLFALRTATADRSQFLTSVVTTTGSALVVALAIAAIFLVRQSERARDEAEARLRDSNTNLESAVEERTSDLREANEEIQRFAYIVSHDLRSPLVNIMGFTSELEELRGDIFGRLAKATVPTTNSPPLAAGDADGEPILTGNDQKLSDEYIEAIGFIKASIGKMDRLINAILHLTREGRREFQPEHIDPRELISNIASTVAHQASEADASIRIEPLPELVSDRLAMEQIFSNLIDNALKYLKPGTPGDVQIKGRSKLGYVIYEVKDNGRGIDPKDHQRIFDLFRRAGTQDRPGQGIGLAHVRALVRRLGGTLSVSSELNEGSTFTVMLPAKLKLSSEDRRT